MIATRERDSDPPPPLWMDPNFLGAKKLLGVDVGRVFMIRYGIPGLIRHLRRLSLVKDQNWDAYILDRVDLKSIHVFSFDQFWLGVAVLMTKRKPTSFEECRKLLIELLTSRRETGKRFLPSQFSEQDIQFALDIHDYTRAEKIEGDRIPTRPSVLVNQNGQINGAVIPDVQLLSLKERQKFQSPLFPLFRKKIVDVDKSSSVETFESRVPSPQTRTTQRPRSDLPAPTPPPGAFEMERREFGTTSPQSNLPEFGQADFEPRPAAALWKSNKVLPTAGYTDLAGDLRGKAIEGSRFVRTPHMNAPKQVIPGERFSVFICMDEEKSEEGEVSSEIDIVVPSDLQRLDFTVWLTGTEHFTFVNSMKTLSVVRAKSRSELVGFDVIVRDEIKDYGEAQLLAVFCYNDRVCGNVSRSVKVWHENGHIVPPAENLNRRKPVLRIDTNAQPADLTLLITNPSGDERTFECQIATPLLVNSNAEQTKWLLPTKTKDLVYSFFRLFLKPPPPNGENDPTRLAYLRGAGKHLFKATPDLFQKIYWELVDSGKALRTISIVTDEPYFPWELILPHRPGEERNVLGVEYAIGRTVSRDYMTPPQVIKLNESWVFAPIYRGQTPPPLAKTADEANFVTTQFHGDVVAPADFAGFENAMQKPRSLVHFVCHGNATELGQSIYDDNSMELFSTAFNGGKYTPRAYEKARPFVFLNACKVGQTDRSFNGLGGFAPTFLEMGASCVIAPLWSVKDTVAHDIALEFYEETVKDPTRSFASILSKIRARAYENGEDTYAAYCFYGDPLACQEC